MHVFNIYNANCIHRSFDPIVPYPFLEFRVASNRNVKSSLFRSKRNENDFNNDFTICRCLGLEGEGASDGNERGNIKERNITEFIRFDHRVNNTWKRIFQ